MIDVTTVRTYVNEGLAGRVNGAAPRVYRTGVVSPSKLAAKTFFADVLPLTLAAFLTLLTADQVAWLTRQARDRYTFVLADLDRGHKLLPNVAVNYATSYAGRFAFMLAMQAAARQWGGLTPRQSVAVLNCLLGDIRHAEAARVLVQPPVPASAPVALPQAGVYTVLLGADDYRTIKVLPSDYKAGVALVASFLSGADNTGDYTGFADINADGSLRVWAKFRASSGLIAALRTLLAGDDAAVLTAAHCRRCGKLLSVPQSLYQGYGPTCAKKVGIA